MSFQNHLIFSKKYNINKCNLLLTIILLVTSLFESDTFKTIFSSVGLCMKNLPDFLSLSADNMPSF